MGKMKLCLLAVGLGLGLSLSQCQAHTKRGNFTTIVHLFEWRWSDIAEECEKFLAPNGFDGVQISPPSESVVVTKPWRPWWERYQPVSYTLCSRSGTEPELRDMIRRCNDVGVKIYADAVINHMCSSGAGEGGRGATCGSYFNASAREFPSVPYAAPHFNDDKCETRSGNIETYQDIYQVIDMGGEPIRAREYFGLGLVTEFLYGAKLGSVIRRWNGGKLCDLKNMVMFRNEVGEEALCNWWDNGSNQIAFGRGNRGFIVINNDDCVLDLRLHTGLPSGTYCDVISGQREGVRCSGRRVAVDEAGRAHFYIANDEQDPVIAVHLGSRLGP